MFFAPTPITVLSTPPRGSWRRLYVVPRRPPLNGDYIFGTIAGQPRRARFIKHAAVACPRADALVLPTFSAGGTVTELRVLCAALLWVWSGIFGIGSPGTAAGGPHYFVHVTWREYATSRCASYVRSH